MSMVLVNPENGRLLDVLRSRKNEYLTHYFNAVRQRVQAGSSGYMIHTDH